MKYYLVRSKTQVYQVHKKDAFLYMNASLFYYLLNFSKALF